MTTITRAPPRFVAYHPLEREARRALSLTRRVGHRLAFQLRALDYAEDASGGQRGSAGLPDEDWRRQFALYATTLLSLIAENRRMMSVRSTATAVDEEDESEEIIAAVELLTEDELKRALERRAGCER